MNLTTCNTFNEPQRIRKNPQAKLNRKREILLGTSQSQYFYWLIKSNLKVNYPRESMFLKTTLQSLNSNTMCCIYVQTPPPKCCNETNKPFNVNPIYDYYILMEYL